MKKLIYLLTFVAVGLFSACHDITVGYLVIDETASYPTDTMIVVTKAENELQKIKNVETSLYLESQEIQDEMEELDNQIYEIQMSDEYYFDELWDEMDDPDFWDIDGLTAKVDEKYGVTDLQSELDELSSQLNNLAATMGIESLEILKKDIEEWQNKVKYKFPYVSSEIDGVLGTDILYFRVINVKSENAGNSAKFMDNVEVKGHGQISVNYNPDVPVGTYLLTLEVKNEGRTKIIEDVFTVIIKDIPEETPIPRPGE